MALWVSLTDWNGTAARSRRPERRRSSALDNYTGAVHRATG